MDNFRSIIKNWRFSCIHEPSKKKKTSKQFFGQWIKAIQRKLNDKMRYDCRRERSALHALGLRRSWNDWIVRNRSNLFVYLTVIYSNSIYLVDNRTPRKNNHEHFIFIFVHHNHEHLISFFQSLLITELRIRTLMIRSDYRQKKIFKWTQHWFWPET